MKYMTRLRCMILMVCFIWASSCGTLKPPVHYLLPDGYVGMFKIILDESNGIDAKPEGGVYTLVIPPEGVLRIKSFTPFDAWHEVSASYKSGKEIPVFGSTVPDDAVALRDMGTHQRAYGPSTKTIVIGTKQQAERVRKDKLETEFDDTPPVVYNQRLRTP